jgi:hypothetical protein
MLAALAVEKATGKDGHEMNPSGKCHCKSTNLKTANHFNGLEIEDSSDEEDATFVGNTLASNPPSTPCPLSFLHQLPDASPQRFDFTAHYQTEVIVTDEFEEFLKL